MIKPSTSIFLIIYCLFIIVVFNKNIYSSTSITISGSPIPITDIDTNKMANQIQHTTDLNGPFIADAFALANVLGYPIGKSYIGSFPHFELGIAVGAGCTNMKYFDKDDPAHDNGTLPMFAPNPVLHFGLGLGGGFDVLGKAFYISKSVINKYKSDIDYEARGTTLKDFKIYSTGVKLRYNYIKEKRVLPFYLAFGGVTFSLGCNFIYGDISFIGDYKYDFDDISVNVPAPTNIPMNFDGQFEANIHWAIFTLDAQAIAYFDIFYIFSLYTGFGVAGNIGAFKLESTGEGAATTTNSTYQTFTGTNQIGTVTFSSKNRYRSSPVIPLYILGLEINILVLKLNAETMVNLHNRSDVNVQFGTRLQF